MVTSGRSLRAVICEDEPMAQRALVDTIRGLYGIEVVATLTSGVETVASAAGAKPDLVVVDLALAGVWGLRIVPRLLSVAPDAVVVVVVLSPYAGLRDAAVEAGAMVLVDLSDLRPLRGCLEHLHAQVHSGVGCPCCAATGSAVAGGRAQLVAHHSVRPSHPRRPDAGGSSSTASGGPP